MMLQRLINKRMEAVLLITVAIINRYHACDCLYVATKLVIVFMFAN